MVRMVTKATHQYAGRRLHEGDEYDCEEQHVSLMQRFGWASPKVEEPPAPQVYETRQMVAASPRRRRRK